MVSSGYYSFVCLQRHQQPLCTTSCVLPCRSSNAIKAFARCAIMLCTEWSRNRGIFEKEVISYVKVSWKRWTIFSPVFRLKFFRCISRSITSLWPPSCYSRDDWPSWMHHSSLSSPIYRHYLSKVSSSIDRCTHRAIYLFVPKSDYLVSREKIDITEDYRGET